MTTAQNDHAATLLADGSILIAGGQNEFGYLSLAPLPWP
jgi:hypothetical protein